MNVESELQQAYEEAKTLSSASFAYMSGSTMLSCSCYKSYSSGWRYEYSETGFKTSYVDLSVLVDRQSISASLEPLKTEVWVDSEKYLVGNVITNNPVTSWITLRQVL